MDLGAGYRGRRGGHGAPGGRQGGLASICQWAVGKLARAASAGSWGLLGHVMLIASNGRIMGRLTLNLPMWVGGWAATAIMAAASIGFFVL